MSGESFSAVAAALVTSIDDALPQLRAIPESRASASLAPGKWSPKQFIGHLIDSASNNHQRFVRAQEGSPLAFPRYEQKHWVSSQHYDKREWSELVALWHT